MASEALSRIPAGGCCIGFEDAHECWDVSIAYRGTRPAWDATEGKWFTFPGEGTDDPRFWCQLAVVMTAGTG